MAGLQHGHAICASQHLQDQPVRLVRLPTPQVAREVSEDKARQGGDLGWKTRKELVASFADAAFALNVSRGAKAPRSDLLMVFWHVQFSIPDPHFSHAFCAGGGDDTATCADRVWISLDPL